MNRAWNRVTQRVKSQTMSPIILTVLCLPLPNSDYPHKYGPEGGCADGSVFEKMKKYQASAVEEPHEVKHTTCRTMSPHSGKERVIILGGGVFIFAKCRRYPWKSFFFFFFMPMKLQRLARIACLVVINGWLHDELVAELYMRNTAVELGWKFYRPF